MAALAALGLQQGSIVTVTFETDAGPTSEEATVTVDGETVMLTYENPRYGVEPTRFINERYLQDLNDGEVYSWEHLDYAANPGAGGGQIKWWPAATIHHLKDALQPEIKTRLFAGQTALELGCGTHPFIADLHAQAAELQLDRVVLTDMNEELLNNAKANWPENAARRYCQFDADLVAPENHEFQDEEQQSLHGTVLKASATMLVVEKAVLDSLNGWPVTWGHVLAGAHHLLHKEGRFVSVTSSSQPDLQERFESHGLSIIRTIEVCRPGDEDESTYYLHVAEKLSGKKSVRSVGAKKPAAAKKPAKATKPAAKKPAKAKKPAASKRPAVEAGKAPKRKR
jgi:hypothetical protein